MPRQAGETTPPEDRAKWSMSRLVSETKKLIRTDWGGQRPGEATIKKLVDLGVPEELAREVGPATAKLCQEQVLGCRKRCSHNFGELSRRIKGG